MDNSAYKSHAMRLSFASNDNYLLRPRVHITNVMYGEDAPDPEAKTSH